MKSLNNCVICNGKRKGEFITIDDKKYHLNCIKDLANKPIPYDRLLKIARKMHLWIFLNISDEFVVYDELELTDEENSILGSSKSNIVIDDSEIVEHVKNVIDNIEGGNNEI